MDDYLLKPVSQIRLLETMRLFLGDPLEYNIQQLQEKEDLESDNHKEEEKLRQELTEMLTSELPKMMKDLNTASAENDTENLFQIAHKIHGATVYCDMPEVKEASINLERACRGGDINNLPKLLEKLTLSVNKILSSTQSKTSIQ